MLPAAAGIVLTRILNSVIFLFVEALLFGYRGIFDSRTFDRFFWIHPSTPRQAACNELASAIQSIILSSAPTGISEATGIL